MKKLKVLKLFFVLLITFQLFTCCSTSSILSQVIGKEWSVTSIKGKILEFRFAIGNQGDLRMNLQQI